MNEDEGIQGPDWNRQARYVPTVPPVFQHRNREAKLRQPYVGVWITSTGQPAVITPYGCHLRKSVETTIRRHMIDGSSSEMNHHTRYYIWDTSIAWSPESLNCWTPIAERPRDQWVPSY
jgi:hypothetical protein